MSDQPNNGPAPEDQATMERIVQAQRVVGESRMIRTDTDAAALPAEAARAIVERVSDYIRQKGISRNRVARAIGVSDSVLKQVLRGTYDCGTAAAIVLDLDRWLERQHTIDGQPKLADFVWTTVAQEVRAVAKLAIRASLLGQDARIGLVWGDTGCGKTMALKAIAQTEPGALMVTMDYAQATAAGVMEKIAAALGIDLVGANHRRLFDAVRSKLDQSARLLIVDEIHALLAGKDDQAFHTLRHLHDQTGAPQLWSSTPDLIAQLRFKESRGREPLSQIRSRIGIQRDLIARTRPDGSGGGDPLFTVEEIIRIYAKAEIRLSRDGAHYLASVANTPQSGGLRTVTTIVGTAAFTFKGTHSVLTAELLRSMHQTLDGRGYEAHARTMEPTAARMTAKVG